MLQHHYELSETAALRWTVRRQMCSPARSRDELYSAIAAFWERIRNAPTTKKVQIAAAANTSRASQRPRPT